MKMLEATVEGLALDMTTNSPVVILSPIGLDKVLPIWIGHAEAWGIAMELSGVSPKRPMTYDLIKQVIGTLKARVDRVEVTELKDQTFYAVIHLSCDGEKYEIDARPSDSIVVALKVGAKIYVNEGLFHLSEIGESPEVPPMPTDRESLRDRLKRINPEDFGKYQL
ncbi:MAG: bifunctional nuclease family protein [candidate division Zixibacteria bacterium]|nr:bifunctional nuclease family protein [candidate division Zixibacteria bacterium]MCK4605728.1 bifunctional nuclease family protein [candidate division Zixibacteria bacterium]